MPKQLEITPRLKRIRQSSAANPLGLEIGDHVKIRRSVEVGYDEDGNRKMFFGSEWEHHVFITGSTKRALGTYVKGGGSGREWLGGFDCEYEEPSLKVSRYVRLYTYRYTFCGKEFLVHPDDILTTPDEITS